jgi:Predicted ATPase
VLNFPTGELKNHSPEYFFIDHISVRYHPSADTAAYEHYFDDWTERDADRKALIEMIGHALVPDANERYKKFLMLTGAQTTVNRSFSMYQGITQWSRRH